MDKIDQRQFLPGQFYFSRTLLLRWQLVGFYETTGPLRIIGARYKMLKPAVPGWILSFPRFIILCGRRAREDRRNFVKPSRRSQRLASQKTY